MLTCFFIVLIASGLTLAPAELGYDNSSAADFARVSGSLIASIAVLALWDVLAPLLWLCALGGLAILFSPLWLQPMTLSVLVAHLIAGLLISAFGLIGRKRALRYGGGWRSLVKSETPLTKITWS